MMKFHMNRNTCCLLLFLFTVLSASGCTKKKECEGCDSDAPWSNPKSDYCYTTRDRCDAAEEDDCYRCD